MEKFTITNRYGLNIVGLLHIPQNPVGLAFVLHGLGGFKEQDHIQVISNTFLNNNYIVVNFDATNSIGESEGKYENATMQKHYEDLVDVVEWTKTQNWYQEPFILAGHSLGGFAVAKYAEEYPDKIKAVFPFAAVYSGEQSFEATERFESEKLKNWEETGWTYRTSNSKPGIEMKLPWSHMKERLAHNLYLKVLNLTMPVLFVVGENDGPCPSDHQKIFHDALPELTEREFHIIKGAPHTFRTPEHLAELGNILDAWIKKLR
ncbi:MAG: alpha/beta fold hydrolase [Candidatus Pacebacteria bacterium]|nr:alpha/beta fold hydrolase [Candidatus Paceibacterota bacterium]